MCYWNNNVNKKNTFWDKLSLNVFKSCLSGL